MAVAINYISLFSGHGGLDIGFRLGCEAIGIVARCVGYVEREAYAASCLLARMEESALERAPVFCGDIQDVRGREFRSIENLWIIGGFPCQDISVAGKGAGIAQGTRSGLWFEYARIVEESGAVGVFAENVAAITRNGLDIVLQDLARLGFDAEWDCFTAAQVGAPHKRERWFCMANRAGQRRQQRRLPEGRRQEGLRAPDVERSREDMADAAQRGQRERRQSSECDGQPDGRDETLDDPASPRRDAAGQRPEAVRGGGECLSREGCNELANPEDANRGGRISGEEEGAGPGESGRRGFTSGSAGLANAEHGALPHTRRESLGRDGPGQSGEVGNAAGARRKGRGGIGGSPDELLPLPFPPSPALFPPGPGDREAWERIVADTPWLAPAVGAAQIEPAICRMAHGMAYRPHNMLNCAHGQTNDTEAGAARLPEDAPLRELRSEGNAATPSRRLLSTVEGADSLHAVPREAGQGGRNAQDSQRSALRDLQEAFPAKAQTARYAMWLVEMQSRLRSLVGATPLGRQAALEILRSVWRGVSVQEAAREDLLEYLRSLARMEQPSFWLDESRADQLRGGGNGVVPLCAAYAFVALAQRIDRRLKVEF